MKEQIEELAKKLRAYCYDIELKDNDDCRRLADFIIETLGYRKQEWISVEERLPSKSGKHICCTTKGTILIERFYQLDDGGWFSNHNFCTVTHWIPLPEAPKMKGGAE